MRHFLRGVQDNRAEVTLIEIPESLYEFQITLCFAWRCTSSGVTYYNKYASGR
jgi:hypothetical protein